MIYTVRGGETLYDISMNAVGSLAALDAIMTAAGATGYSDMVPAGTALEVNVEISNNAAVIAAAENPFNNSHLPDSALDGMINAFLRDLNAEATVATFAGSAVAFKDNTVPAHPR